MRGGVGGGGGGGEEEEEEVVVGFETRGISSGRILAERFRTVSNCGGVQDATGVSEMTNYC